MRLGARTDLTALNLTEDTAVRDQRRDVHIFRSLRTRLFEVDTPNTAVTLEARVGTADVDGQDHPHHRAQGRATIAARRQLAAATAKRW